MPPGRASPDAYRDGSDVPPSPRQLRPFLREHGSAKTIALFRRFRTVAPKHPIFTEDFELNLVSDLLDQGRTEEAIAFCDYFREVGVDCEQTFMKVGNAFHKMGRKDWAAGYYQRVLLLKPSNQEAANKLKELGGERGSKK
jgi:hypothetical protein